MKPTVPKVKYFIALVITIAPCYFLREQIAFRIMNTINSRPHQFEMVDFANSTITCNDHSASWKTLHDLFLMHDYNLQKRSSDKSINTWSPVASMPPKYYAVFSTSTRGQVNTNALYLIFTALAWRHIEMEILVIITGDVSQWQERKLLRYIVEYLVFMKVTLVLVHTKEHEVILSQTARLFIWNYLKLDSEKETVIVTTDADLLPLRRDFYSLPEGKKLMVLNSDCCGYFTREGKRYKLLPISNIIMSAYTWKSVMAPYNSEPHTAQDIIRYVTDDLGSSRSSKLHVGRADEIIWNADQIILSMRIAEYEETNSEGNSIYKPRLVWLDRIDRDLTLVSYPFSKDVHLPLNTFNTASDDIWRKMQKVLTLTFGEQYEGQWQALWENLQKCISMKDRKNK